MPNNVRWQIDREFATDTVTWAYSSANFWRRIMKLSRNECWTWTGSTGPSGPLFGAWIIGDLGERETRMTQARRILYAETHGRWPTGSLFHACGNRSCMNPEHLTDTRPRADVYYNYREHHPEAL